MILGISWRDKVSNKKVMIRVQTELQTELHFTKDMIKRKLEYAGHVLRGSSGLSHLQILEGKLEGKKKVGCPIRIWMNDICDWSLLGTYGKVKRAAEDRKRWKLIVVNLRNGINPLSFPVELRYDDVTLKRANEELALLFFFIIIDTSLLYSTNVYFTFKHFLFFIITVRY